MRKITALLTLLLLAGLGQWSFGASPEAYLPLQEGMTWEFQQKLFNLKSKAQLGEAKAIKKNLAPRDIKGIKGHPQVFSSYQPGGTLKHETTSFITQDAEGFAVFARQTANLKEPQLLEEKFYILKFPLAKGTAWQQFAEGFLLQTSIESTTDTVQVPAGTFHHCVVIKKLYLAGRDSKQPAQEARFWFAPGVGTVKVVTKNFHDNQEIVQELVSFKK